VKRAIGLISFIVILSMSVTSQMRDQSSTAVHIARPESGGLQSGRNRPDFAAIPLYFIPNRGQFDRQAAFCARASSYVLWAAEKELIFDFARKKKSLQSERTATEYERDISRLIFRNSGNNPNILAVEPSEHLVNYFLGNDPEKWVKGVKTSSAILYKKIYPAIDLKVYGLENEIEYDWIVKPGGEVSSIQFEYQDVGGTRIDQDGNLIVTTKFGKLVNRKPVGYQMIAGSRVAVDVAFKRVKDHSYAFETGNYDRTYELIIDPVVLVFSTFLGGRGEDRFGRGIAVDKDQCVYVTGSTFSSNFPVKSAYDPTHNGKEDVFVTKFNKSGRGLVYSTFIGGPSWEFGSCLTVDNGNNAYLGGLAYDGFPTKNAYDDDYDDSLHGDYYDGIVVKLNPAGNLVYSTYLGKADDDEVFAIAVDSAGRACVSGFTENSDFPTKSPLFPSYQGKGDIFVTVFSAEGNSLVFSTFLGGSEYETLGNLVLDKAGSIFITGFTHSSNFPVKNAYDSSYNGKSDAFLVKLEPLGRSLIYSTFLGGSKYDVGADIAVDDNGSAYLTGWTDSGNFPKKNAFDRTLNGKKDVFIVKFAANGKSLVYSTYVGGAENDFGYGIVLTRDGEACVAGLTYSPEFPCLNAYDDSYNDMGDAFVLKLSATGTWLIFSTYLGGGEKDGAKGMAVDKLGYLYIAGETYSADFPVKSAYDMSFNGGEYDLFIAKLK